MLRSATQRPAEPASARSRQRRAQDRRMLTSRSHPLQAPQSLYQRTEMTYRVQCHLILRKTARRSPQTEEY
jgi:hypothetical protein